MKWKGTGIDFSNIIFTRRYHPPMRNTVHNNILADYSYDDNITTLYLPGFRNSYGKKETKTLVNGITRVFIHEPIHGIIWDILAKDLGDCEFNPEWPMYNGMDVEHTKAYKREIKKHENHGKRIF